jgi:hypothetical protein
VSIYRFIHSRIFSCKGSIATFLVVIFFVSLDLMVFIGPYLVHGYVVPVGWDKAWYIRNMRIIEKQGFLPLFKEIGQVNLFSPLEYVISYVSGASFIFTAGAVPIVCAIAFLFLYQRITQELSKSLQLGIFSMILTIIDYNLLRTVGTSVDRGLFTFLMIAISLFIVLPRLIEKTSRVNLLSFSFLQISAGMSQMETYGINLFVLAMFLFIGRKKYPLKKLRLILLGTIVPLVLILAIQFPYLPEFFETHIINPSSSPWRPIEGEIAHPVSYLLSLGSGLIGFFVLGLHRMHRRIKKQKEHSLPLLIFLWNMTVIILSFAPIVGLRIPGWRLLLLTTVPPLATIGFSEFFLNRNLGIRRMLIILSVASITCTILVVNQYVNYRPWLSQEEFSKLNWISSNKQTDSVVFIIYYDFGKATMPWAELHSNWIRAIVGTETDVYFGEVQLLLQSEPTPSDEYYVNYTSYEYWSRIKNVSPRESENYLIVEWYEAPIDPRYSRQLSEAGIFLSEIS